MKNLQCIFVVSGRVQCVGFRYHTSRQAHALSISGYAKNLNDGCVEVLAVGDLEQIEKLYAWLKLGPSSATVDQVVKHQISETDKRAVSAGEFKIL
ncbi:acylphosphatase [Vibrio splendidus]|uniref:acylphosphatase n=1 Tax=Vibrio lentus TaxID=136468 RepID=A0A4U2EFN3_9VIBR|nr:acylphosphatase [Vibrio lentus]PHN83766.1 acylphosphatase [Vibrio splendidus]TKG01531.1 acylphosphatase [Vibrio lentus]